MESYKYLYTVLFALCILVVTACGGRPEDQTVPTPIILIATPTAAAIPNTPTVSVPVVSTETSVPIIVTEIAAVTEVPATVPVDPTPTDAPTVAVQDCILPNPPEGAFYITYTVEAGDTLFTIGQQTRPAMTIQQIADANCLTDVNRIEVGQQLVVWHSPTSGPATQALVFGISQAGPLANYTGPLAFGDQAFTFDGTAGQNVNIISRSGRSPLLLFTLEKSDGSGVVGSVTTTDRFYLDPNSRGRQFVLSSDGEYRLRIQGNPGVLLDFTVILDTPRDAVLGVPQRIAFEAGGTSARILGTSAFPQLERYVFGAAAGQLVEIDVIKEFNVEVWVEDSNENILFRTDGVKQGQFTLPATGDYILTVFHGGSEVYLYGDYEVDLSITTPGTVATATPVAAATPGAGDSVTLTFSDGINGWQFANDAGILNDQGKKTVVFYAGGGQNLSFVDRSGSNLSFQLAKGDGTVQVGSVSMADRNYLDPLSNGGYFTLPETAEYHLFITGFPGAPYDLGVVWGAPPHPTLGVPARVEFAAGAISTQISGTTAPGTMDRYVFRALAEQTVTLAFNQAADTLGAHAWLETSGEVVLLKTEAEGFKPIILPATDDYILTIIHPAGEVYGSGPYDLTLTIQ